MDFPSRASTFLLSNLGYATGGTFLLIAFFLFKINRPAKDGVKFPTWILIEGYIISQSILAGGLFKQLTFTLRRNRGPLFGMTQTHQLIYNPQIAKNILKKPLHLVDTEPVRWDLMIKVFGARPGSRAKLTACVEDLFDALSKHLVQESSGKMIMKKTFARIQEWTPRLVSFSQDRSALWASPAGCRVGSPESADMILGVEADLFTLARDFVTAISISVLAGSDFMQQYPQAIDDLWALDNAFPILAIGVPAWAPFEVIKKAVAARERFHQATVELHERIEKVATGEADEALMSRTADISQVFWDRGAAYRRHDIQMSDRGPFDLTVFWAMNANTSPFVFWLIVYIYSTPGLLDQLRCEISPYVRHDELTSLSTEGVLHACPLLKSTYFETFRIAHEPTSVRYIAQPLSVSDTDRSSNYKVTLSSGSFITVPHGLSHFDPEVFPEPENFVPGRFMHPTKNDNIGDSDTHYTVRYGPLRPWGEGPGMCKGRIFAEREVLVVAAYIITLWDIEPKGGHWELPQKKPGTGVFSAKTPLRVIFKRRPVK